MKELLGNEGEVASSRKDTTVLRNYRCEIMCHNSSLFTCVVYLQSFKVSAWMYDLQKKQTYWMKES